LDNTMLLLLLVLLVIEYVIIYKVLKWIGEKHVD
jgi:UPF0716 family protein affecting phage T7 exclusion